MLKCVSALIIMLFTSIAALSQIVPHPEQWEVIFGNRDGSLMSVKLGDTIQVPVWGRTDPNDYVDSVIYMHIPLATNNSYFTSRIGGLFPDTLVGRWDDIHFLTPNLNSPINGFTNQSMLGYAYLMDPRDNQNFFYTLGDTVLICTFKMVTTTNPAYGGQTVCPFREGLNPANGELLWGMQDGVTDVVPHQTYGCIYFDTSSVCIYIPGDANGNGTFNGIDVNYGVTYFKGGPPPPYSCNCPTHGTWYVSGDVNASCSYNGLDITYAVAYFKGGPPPHPCADCPPSGLLTPPAPGIEPIKKGSRSYTRSVTSL